MTYLKMSSSKRVSTQSVIFALSSAGISAISPLILSTSLTWASVATVPANCSGPSLGAHMSKGASSSSGEASTVAAAGTSSCRGWAAAGSLTTSTTGLGRPPTSTLRALASRRDPNIFLSSFPLTPVKRMSRAARKRFDPRMRFGSLGVLIRISAASLTRLFSPPLAITLLAAARRLLPKKRVLLLILWPLSSFSSTSGCSVAVILTKSDDDATLQRPTPGAAECPSPRLLIPSCAKPAWGILFVPRERGTLKPCATEASRATSTAPSGRNRATISSRTVSCRQHPSA
mmetsp:Transcript_11642/g.27005  ORF Transcript_11642/g.27005 Transcript_11642/m.27005 type:complete len:288 (-) Transcript_11642:8-871(-)